MLFISATPLQLTSGFHLERAYPLRSFESSSFGLFHFAITSWIPVQQLSTSSALIFASVSAKSVYQAFAHANPWRCSFGLLLLSNSQLKRSQLMFFSSKNGGEIILGWKEWKEFFAMKKRSKVPHPETQTPQNLKHHGPWNINFLSWHFLPSMFSEVPFCFFWSCLSFSPSWLSFSSSSFLPNSRSWQHMLPVSKAKAPEDSLDESLLEESEPDGRETGKPKVSNWQSHVESVENIIVTFYLWMR